MHGPRTCGSIEDGSGAQEQQDTNEGVVQEADVEEHLPNRAGQVSVDVCTGNMSIYPMHNTGQHRLPTAYGLHGTLEKLRSCWSKSPRQPACAQILMCCSS